MPRQLYIAPVKKIFLFFFRYMTKYPASRKRALITSFLIIIEIIAVSLIPYTTKCLIDNAKIDLNLGLGSLLLLLGVLWTVEKTINHLQEITLFPATNHAIRDITHDLIYHIHQIDYSDYQTLSVPETLNAIRRISLSARTVARVVLLSLIPTTIKCVVAVIVACQLGLYGCVLLPAFILSFFTLYKGTKWYIAIRAYAWEMTDVVCKRTNDSLLNSKTLRNQLMFEDKTISSLLEEEANRWNEANFRLHGIHIIIGIIMGGAFTIVLFASLYGLANGTLTLGEFVMLKGQLISAFLPIKHLSTEFRQLMESCVDIGKVIQLLDIPLRRLKIEKQKMSQDNALVDISLENIIFSFNPESESLFKGLSIKLKVGEKIGIVGKNGCGKSTLLAMINGLYPPDSGNMNIFKGIHLIPQDIRLMNLSLRDNLCYDSQNISDTRLIQAITLMGLEELMLKLPNKLDTIVGELGSYLSGGEIRRLVLARAWLLKPQVLLLDETLDCLNEESKRDILEIIRDHFKTVIIVSHHASIVEKLDRVLVLEEGKLIEDSASNVPSLSNTLSLESAHA